MKKWLFILFSGFSFLGYTQEFSATGSVEIAIPQESYFKDLIYIRPSLSSMTPSVPLREIQIREVNFAKRKDKVGVDLIAMMEKERAYKESIAESSIQPSFAKEEKPVFTIYNNVHLYSRGSNYDPYTGELKNPAYREMRAGLFNPFYSPYNREVQYIPLYSPYFFSPSLR